ncbi:MAG: lysophospholipid acyltransferase family protein [Pontiellaceae bacterium]|jgi:KDO2-lipid IV(A) lauroyltransferase|nr:lysophospholipid acyltransferase family protein [Pontiellaceae bacterium]
MNPLRERTEYFCLQGLIGILKILPDRLIDGIFRLLGALFFLLGTRRRNLTLRNIRIAFPEKSRKERLGIAWRSFQNMALFTGDSFRITAGKLTLEEIKLIVDDTDIKKYRAIRTDPGRGVLHLTGHLGNWELLANYAAICGYPSNIISRQGNNRLIDAKIVVPGRTRYGNKIFYKKNALLFIGKALCHGEAVAFQIDQKISRKQGVPVQFFGREAMAISSSAALQIRFNPLVIPVFVVKTGTHRYKLLVGDPVEWIDDGSPHEEQIQKLTQRHQNLIEEMIRQYPDQWFWMHNRWGLS